MPPLPAPSSSAAAPDRLTAAVLGAALRRIEEPGPLDDQELLRRALAAGGDRQQQILQRNLGLGERLGLQRELARWRQLGWLLVLLLAGVMALAGLATARSVLAPDRSINAVAALVGVLALPTLTLLAWLVLLPLAHRGTGTGGGWSLGHTVLTLAARLPLGRGAHASPLLQALLEVMQRQRLWPWFSGLASHAIWLLALLLTLVLLVFGFSFQAYQLSWETTILSPEFFQRFVAASGWLPQLLGFSVPDAAAVQRVGEAMAGTDLAAQRAWAWWLIGCIVVYGLLPRVLLLVLSYWRWRTGLGRLLAVDMADPYNQRLARRLDALAPHAQVLDPEGASAAAPPWAGTGAGTASAAPAVIGFELPPDLPWPTPGLPPVLARMLRVDGSARAVQQVLQQLTMAPPAAALLVLHAPASPDRGAARFLREVARLAGRCAVVLAHADGGPASAVDTARWQAWLRAQALPPLDLLPQVADAARWLEGAHA